MATEVNLSNLDYALKRMYSSRKMSVLAFTNHPFLAKVKKNTKYSGSAYAIPVIDSDVQGASHTYSTAYNNLTGVGGAQFLVTVVQDYALAQISGKLIASTKSDAGRFVDAITHVVDSAFRTAGRRLAAELFGDGSGKIGTIGAYNAGPPKVITLSSVNDVTKFSVNQTIDIYTGVNPNTTATITAVDYDAGQITITTGGVPLVNDTIYNAGDYGAGLKGWLAWNPTTAPASGDNFFGVDRSVNPAMRAGHRFSTAGASTKAKMLDFGAKCSRVGCNLNTIFMNPLDFGTLASELEDKTQYVDSGEDKQFGLRGLQMWLPSGAVSVYADMDVPSSRIFGCNLDAWELLSAGETPTFLTFGSSGKVIDIATSDAVFLKVGGYHQLVCYDTSQIATASL